VRTAGSLCIGNSAMAASLPDGSRVRRESHARFCERLEVKSLRPTLPTIRILAKGKTRTGRLWTYVRDDRPFAGPDLPAAVFFYSPDRGGAHPEQHLAGYAGLMQADAYAGFGRLYEANRKGGPTIEAACWAHDRRKFFDLARLTKAPIAAEAVKRINVLFAIEREINGLAAQERLRVRQERSRPLIVELEAWLREQRAKLSRNNDTTKEINYCLSRWDASRFLDDGRLCIPNNAAERELRAVAVGRKNWTFAGSDEGGRRAAAIYSFIATAKPMTSIRRLGSLTCWRACRITPPSASTNSCPGIGDLSASLRPHKRGQASAQDDLTRGRHRTRTVTPQIKLKLRRRSAGTGSVNQSDRLRRLPILSETIPTQGSPG